MSIIPCTNNNVQINNCEKGKKTEKICYKSESHLHKMKATGTIEYNNSMQTTFLDADQNRH